MGLLSAMLALLGCDQQRISELEEGLSTEADVRARFGEPGMAMEEVRRMLGRPMKTLPLERQRAMAWDWRYLEPPNSSMVFTVYFNSDYRVLRTGSAPDPEASGNRGG